MASVVFDGLTIGDDAAGSTYRVVSRFQDEGSLGQALVQMEPVGRYPGMWAAVLGTDPGLVVVSFTLWVAASTLQAWRSAVDAKIGVVGTLTTPRLGSVSNCLYVGGGPVQPSGPGYQPGTGTREYVGVGLVWRRVR